MVGIRQFDEEKLLAEAEGVFRAKGLEGTSMADLAVATGVQRGSLYNAYGDKEALFLRSFARYEARFLAAAEEALVIEDLRMALIAFLEAAIANMTVAPTGRGCLTTRAAVEARQAGGRVRDGLLRLMSELEARLRTALSRPGAAGRLKSSPQQAARLLVVFTRGLAVMERLDVAPDTLRADARALVDLLVPA
ncbi:MULTISPECIES: TetR/AcrR family transcriptional regulator [unclassified Chelatococcus]|uniref:TetR/AcrR family transcriptional regulator n=1 Tax=unclassified Chelatococcus TaxID=2638111 RepID=UPI001BCBC331|nr:MULTISPECIES: TetR/AcrR family transcriptional regulator [unclassified Chelatococcus]CAH1672010.1 TetR family transcriptional regulator [Hyphomicrobiales bacterium]MBS7739005.1 TetR/AcrR family transcriptional regulator [Chelatococcus sp. HY11]MBX3543438.1 TetR/AcrR family transcriptional regulator [Chelatococcus sp.]MCO5076465.1 TetR/AcrR family transcriptional regulator [Chelatococcus sp.]CAH1675771.1 TetR family transcriptional regulator [Hyphomicrobiales bacterium]